MTTGRPASRRHQASVPNAVAQARLRRRRPHARQAVGWLRAAVLIGALAVIVLSLWVTLDDRFYVYDPVVLGASAVPRDRVIQASGLLGWHVFWVRPAAAEASIMSLPGILSATVRCEMPAVCTIVVVEQPPHITWQDGGQLWQIDRSGLAVRTSSPLEDGWYVQGVLPLDESHALVEPVLTGLLELAELDVAMDSRAYYTPDRGIAFVDKRGWLVIVGVGGGMERRLKSLAYVTEAILPTGAAPEWVDVHIAERPFFLISEGQVDDAGT